MTFRSAGVFCQSQRSTVRPFTLPVGAFQRFGSLVRTLLRVSQVFSSPGSVGRP
jgi:hypothetical protein